MSSNIYPARSRDAPAAGDVVFSSAGTESKRRGSINALRSGGVRYVDFYSPNYFVAFLFAAKKKKCRTRITRVVILDVL